MGIALAIAGLVLTVVAATAVYHRQRPRKFIEWWMWSDQALPEVDRQYVTDSVLDAADRLHEPRIVRLTIYNLGRDAIRDDDWDIPATFTFPEGRVVQVVATTNSPDWNAEADLIDAHTARLRPVLMNYFDKITLSLAIDGSSAGVSMTCRIVGQTRSAVGRQSRKPSWWAIHVPEPVRTALAVVLFAFWLLDVSAWLIRVLS